MDIAQLAHTADECILCHEGSDALFPNDWGGLVDMSFADFFEFSVLKHICVVIVLHSLKGIATVVQGPIFFCEHVVNTWISLPCDTNFNSVVGLSDQSATVIPLQHLN